MVGGGAEIDDGPPPGKRRSVGGSVFSRWILSLNLYFIILRLPMPNLVIENAILHWTGLKNYFITYFLIPVFTQGPTRSIKIFILYWLRNLVL